jgi:hypothetical protein
MAVRKGDRCRRRGRQGAALGRGELPSSARPAAEWRARGAATATAASRLPLAPVTAPPTPPPRPPPRRSMPLVFSEPRRVWLAAMDDNESYVKCYSLAQIGM